MTVKFEIVHDKVRQRADDPRQWIVYANGELRAEATSKQSAEDFVRIARDKYESRDEDDPNRKNAANWAPALPGFED